MAPKKLTEPDVEDKKNNRVKKKRKILNSELCLQWYKS